MIDFPDEMDDKAITGAMQRLYPAKQATGPASGSSSSWDGPTASPMPGFLPQRGPASNPAYEDPTKSDVARLGSAIPDWAMGGLRGADKYAVQPFNRMSASGAETGARVGQDITALPRWLTTPGLSEQQAEQEAPERNPITTGVARAAGGVVGGTLADPRMWPMLGAGGIEGGVRPALSSAMGRGFGAQMGYGAIEQANDTAQHWNELSRADAVEKVTGIGLQSVMAMGGLMHSGAEGEAPLPKRAPDAGPNVAETPNSIDRPTTISGASPRSVGDIYASTGMPESKGTPEAEAAARQRYLNLTKGEPIGPAKTYLPNGEVVDPANPTSPREAAANPLAGETPKGSPEAGRPVQEGKAAEVDLSRAPGQENSSLPDVSYLTNHIWDRYNDAIKDPDRINFVGRLGDAFTEGRAKAFDPLADVLIFSKDLKDDDVIAQLHYKLGDKDGVDGMAIEVNSTAPINPDQLNIVLAHEAAHGLRILKGRDMSKNLPYDQRVHEVTANKMAGYVTGFMDVKLKTPASERAAAESIENILNHLPIKEEFHSGISLTASSHALLDRLADNIGAAVNDSTDVQMTKNLIRKAGGEMAQKTEQNFAALQTMLDNHDGDNFQTDMRQFMDAGEGKQTPIDPNDPNGGAVTASFKNPQDAAAFSTIRQMFRERWTGRLKDILDTDDGAGIEQYLKHLWEKRSGTSDLARRIIFGKRDLQGPATFRKSRFYDYFSQGLDSGLTPVTNNVIKMQLLGLREIDRFITAHDIKDQMKDIGLVKFFQNGQDKGDWVRLDDNMFKPKLMKGGLLGAYGEYYAPKDVAKVFNDFLSPGLKGKDGVLGASFDLMHGYGNLLNQAQLSLSAFHGVFSSLNAGISDAALGLQYAFGRENMGLADRALVAGKHIARGILAPLSAFHQYRLGAMLESEYQTPGSHPSFEPIVKAFTQAGGRVGTDPFYRNDAYGSMKVAFQKGDYFSAGYKGVQHLADYSSRWLQKYYVPRLKMGAFAEMAKHKLNEMYDTGASPHQINTELGNIWDSVDNRFGQMTYDNLFWKRASKDIGLLAVRSLGWNIGTVRELGGGAKDLIGNLDAARRGERPEMSSRMAYSLMLPVMVATYGAMYGYATGHPPQTLTDYFHPQTGGTDRDGNPERVDIPSYMKDIFSLSNDWRKTVTNKLHPGFQELHDLWTNKDFYNNEIAHEADPWYKQGMQYLSYIGKNAAPFGIQNVSNAFQSGESAAQSLRGEFGITPAPRDIGLTPASKAATDLSRRHFEQGPFTSEEAQKRIDFSRIRAQYFSGKMSDDDLGKQYDAGKITDHQYDSLMDSKDQTPLQRQVGQLRTPAEFFQVWKKANPDERRQLEDTYDKWFDKVDPEQEPGLYDDYMKNQPEE